VAVLLALLALKRYTNSFVAVENNPMVACIPEVTMHSRINSRGGQKAEFGVSGDGLPIFLQRRSLRTLFVGEGGVEEEIIYFLIIFSKFKLIIVLQFSWKLLCSFKYALC